MRLLLDSHSFLWWCGNDRRLSARARAAIAAPANIVYVSLVSAWEIAIKESLGRLIPPEPVEDAIEAYGFEPLPLSFAHARQVLRLPPHHRDPFDRMLVAQAQCEGLSLVTVDERCRQYDVPVLW